MPIKRSNKVSAEFSASSMSDIIFLLLIFFMLTSTVVSTNALNLKLPSSSSQAPAPAEFIAISIKTTGEVYVQSKPTTQEGLEEAIKAEVRRFADGGKEATVVLNAEEDVPVKDIVKTMAVAEALKLKMILATENREK